MHITASGRGGQQSWSVTAAPRGERRGRAEAVFRVRLSDAGYVISLRQTTGARRELYLCYLTAAEWEAAKTGPFAAFLQMLLRKLQQRRGRELDAAKAAKLDDLAARVRAAG